MNPAWGGMNEAGMFEVGEVTSLREHSLTPVLDYIPIVGAPLQKLFFLLYIPINVPMTVIEVRHVFKFWRYFIAIDVVIATLLIISSIR